MQSRRSILALLSTTAFSSFWCLPFEATASPPSDTASRRLKAIFTASDEAGLILNPSSGVFRGDLRYADRFGDMISDEWLRANELQARMDLDQLLQIDRRALSQSEQIAFDVFRYQTEQAIQSFDTGVSAILLRMPIDSLFGLHLTYPQFSSGEGGAPFATAIDYDNGLKRLDGFAVFLDRVIGKMREGVATRCVHTRVVSEKIIAQLDAVIKDGIDDGAFYKPVRNFPETISAADRARLVAAYRAKIGEVVLPAYRRLRDFMIGEYLPKSREGPPGISNIPGGDKIYAFNLEQFTTTKMLASEIHALGFAEVARIEAEMKKVKAETGFQGSLRQFILYLQSDPVFKFPDRESILNRYGEIKAKVETILPKYFKTLPKAALEVRPVPVAQEGTAGGAYYLVGTADGRRPGVFYANLGNLPTRTSPRMTSLFLHEGVPGHHLQLSLPQEDEALPPFLKFGYNTGYGEGWGLYCEWLGNEMGLYSDPFQRFGHLDMAMIRAVRLVVDTGLHANGWSRAKAIDYMAANTTLTASEVEQEIDRYIVWPGQATAYKVGEIFIRRLRAHAEAALGGKFDIRKFHDQILNSGALPLAVLEGKIDNWVASEKEL
jgi:uncharacterized protein (DUF885 family)